MRGYVVDAYRNKMRSTMATTGQEISPASRHLETRVGKRKWHEHKERHKPRSKLQPTSSP